VRDVREKESKSERERVVVFVHLRVSNALFLFVGARCPADTDKNGAEAFL
jgi:hypothetical protein